MTNILNVINYIFDKAYPLIYILVFYIALKKCFLREGKSKILLFIMVLVTNPMVVITVSLTLPCLVYWAIHGMPAEGEEFTSLSVTVFLAGSLLFILMILLFAWLVGRWMKAYNMSLVMFFYLMFGVVCSLAGENVSEKNIIYLVSPDIQKILQNTVYIAAVLLLYRFVVKRLSELTSRKRMIRWRMFLIPPSLFIPVYYVFDYYTYKYDDGLSNVVVRVYSVIVLVLFIWAFSVIISNINVSNAVIEAQYEAEHDKLTGLYNRGKYMMLKEMHFGNPKSIAMFNFDINNLKYINDNYGHEYGDELIVKAAKSILDLTSDNIYGFRMGGDEYAMVALNITEKETNEIYKRWKQTLEELNTQGDVYCSMACGLKYSEGEFDADELFNQADELMYSDKNARKDRGELSYLKSDIADAAKV